MGHPFWTPGVYWSPCSCWTAREQCVFFWTKAIYMMSFNKTVLGCCCLIKKKKCSVTKEWRANGCSTNKRKRSRVCHEISLELARNESNEDGYRREDCEGASWIFFFCLRKQSRKPTPTFFVNTFARQPFSLISVYFSCLALKFNFFFSKISFVLILFLFCGMSDFDYFSLLASFFVVVIYLIFPTANSNVCSRSRSNTNCYLRLNCIAI